MKRMIGIFMNILVTWNFLSVFTCDIIEDVEKFRHVPDVSEYELNLILLRILSNQPIFRESNEIYSFHSI